MLGTKINDFRLVRIQKKVISPKPVLQVFGTVFKFDTASDISRVAVIARASRSLDKPTNGLIKLMPRAIDYHSPQSSTAVDENEIIARR